MLKWLQYISEMVGGAGSGGVLLPSRKSGTWKNLVVCDLSSRLQMRAGEDNCVEFIKPHWSHVIVFILPLALFFYFSSYLSLFSIPGASFPSPRLIRFRGRGLFGRRLRACVMLDQAFYQAPRARS